MKYKVIVKEVYKVTYLIDAESKAEAKELVREGDGEELSAVYHNNLEDYIDCDTEVTIV